MSAISGYLEEILSAVYGEEVRGAIHDAIEQCYSDVSNPTLQTEALEAALQEKIDEGEMAALTIADGTLTGAKLVDGAVSTAKIANGAVTTEKVANGSITAEKLSDDIDFDVETDTTLTQPGVPADAKAVGDAIAEMGNLSGESLESGEIMKYVLSSKYDDFKLVDGYGYFDAAKLIDSGWFDFDGAPYVSSGEMNYVFRFGYSNRGLLGENIMDGLFSPDFGAEYVEWPGSEAAMGNMQEGYWISKDPDPIRTSKYITAPKSAFGESDTIKFGEHIFNLLDGSVGLKMDASRIVTYDPSEIISAVTSGGSYSTQVVDGVTFYRGFMTFAWADLFDFEYTTANLRRFFNSFGFNESYTYAKEYINVSSAQRISYSVKADAVGGTHTLDNIKNYLVNVRHLKFYYVTEETA